MKGYYKCECGKEFDNPQKFNGHKSHCQMHLKLFNKLHILTDRQDKIKQGIAINKQKRKEERLNK